MRRYKVISTLAMLAMTVAPGWSQDNGSAQGASTPDNGQQSVPVPALGQDTQTAPIVENPPISGIDQPGLEPHAAPLSYLQPGLHVTESADSNISDTLGNSAVHSVTRALASLELQRLWSHYDLALDYVGGAGYFSAGGLGFKDMQQLDLDQKITWKRGQLALRDSFSYMPEGSFGGAYGSEGGIGQTLGGVPGGFWGGTSIASLGQVPRIMNLSLADVTEYLSPKSSLTAAVGYGFVHYTGDTNVQGISFLGSQQLSAQGGYDHTIGHHDQLAVVYGYQKFDFSITETNFHSSIVQLMWGHRISGRMDFTVGAGPQITSINALQPASTGNVPPCVNVPSRPGVGAPTILECPASNLKVSVAGRANLRYKFPKTSLDLVYERFNTNGSGFFNGAETDNVHLSASRPLSRIWTITTALGYAHNRRQVPLSQEQQIGCLLAAASCPGVIANSFDYGFAGVALHRMLGRTVHVFASYQFNELSFDPSFCGFNGAGMSLSPCNRLSQRHVGTIGLDWTPRPIRLD